MAAVDATHDPKLTSWVASANATGSDFPIQNLPFAVFRRAGSREPFRGGVAIGAEILDLGALAAVKPFGGLAGDTLALAAQPALNALMGAGPRAAAALRLALSEALRAGSALAPRLRGLLVPQSGAEYTLAAEVGDYTDFYASIHHATAVGRLFRPDNPLLPNYKWVPIGYHGRASSIVPGGTPVRRPRGQTVEQPAGPPVFGPARRLDYELELGAFLGPGNPQGRPIPAAEAGDHLFGVCLLNDWSARDIQAWEYQPLGPFLSKSFATSISPWVMPMEA
ncbi:MAG TPA: fumarylacetoacetate hydrolase family protein, partial [Steroidobacteraceae bacterium]|nr:fumarylacetoacetate hydrolase family protein [Steroidobacteraceae bacterium]